MDKNKFALTPPMGWNSYDYYDTTVNEEQVKANAIYMAENLKEFGWEYNENEGKAAYDFLKYVHQLSQKNDCVR